MAEVVITRGLPACGKSTWAKAQVDAHPGDVKRVSKDDLRTMLDNGHWNGRSEKLILQIRDAIIRASLMRNCHIIVDDTNLSPRHERRIRQLVSELNRELSTCHTVSIRDFTNVPLETCIERDAQREHPVGEGIVRGMYNQFLRPVEERSPETGPGHGDAIHDNENQCRGVNESP